MDPDRPPVKAVVDTNVIAYYLLGTPEFAAEARTFWQAAGDIMAPALWEAELANVIWMAARSGVISPGEAPARLGLAGRLGIHSVPARRLWQGALTRALGADLPVCGTLFVELAEREGRPLVTFDGRLRRAFPGLCCRPAELAG